jgi:hypothetical protein
VSQNESSQPLAQAAPAPLAQQQPKKQSMLERFGEAYGIEPGKFFNAVKVASGCGQLEDAYFMVLLAQAEKYQLDPLSSPPQLQILNPGGGYQVYARLDAYKSFLIRAEKDGTVEFREYEEGWFPDPRHPPTADKAKTVLRRGGKVTLKLKHWPRERVKYVWLDEWKVDKNPNWTNRASHMLEGRAWKEACRDYLGYHLQDTDDAAIAGEHIAQAQVDSIRDAQPAISPAVPITGRRAALPPPAADPFTIDVPARTPELVEAQGTSTAAGSPGSAEGGSLTREGEGASAGAHPALSPEEEFAAEARRVEAEEVARQQKEREDLFS